ncbi:putative myosin light chain kinase 3 [Conglomerata obtusa]
MLYIFNIFLTIVAVECEKNYDPTKSKHKKVLTFLEEVVRHYIQKGESLQKLPEKFKIKEFRNMRIDEKCSRDAIIIDNSACVAYKICVYEINKDFIGEKLAKKIKSDYICKIYDLIGTTMTITQTKQVLHIKILAMELLHGQIDFRNFYSKYKDKYIDYPKYNDKKLFYNEIYKPKIQRILQHLVKGVKEFHDRQIGILDIKISNLMYVNIENKIYVKMIDLESATYFTNEPVYDGLYTDAYGAPEFDVPGPLTISSDIWSIGMLGYYLIIGKSFFSNGKFYHKDYQEFCANTQVYVDKICACDDFKVFLKLCLEYVPAKRATAAELLSSNFLKDYNDEANDFF